MSRSTAVPAAEYPVIPSASKRLTGRSLGLDIGGTGIKAAVIDLASGELVGERVRELTPRPATPRAVMDVVATVMASIDATGAIPLDGPGGAAFPSVMRAGLAMTATHGVAAWVGLSIPRLLERRVGRSFVAINDADAAGIAEIAYGAGRGQPGVVLVLDLGTGIGSALFVDGQLVPNIQLGHVEFHGREAESRLAPAVRLKTKMSWKTWGPSFNELLARYEAYVWPDLIILGGGLAKDLPKYQRFLKTRAPLVPAALGSNAGMIGAARVGAFAAAQDGTG